MVERSRNKNLGKKRPKKDKKMPNLSLFFAKLEKINGNESLQNISAPQYTFMHHLPPKTGFNHNLLIEWPRNKNLGKKRPKKD